MPGTRTALVGSTQLPQDRAAIDLVFAELPDVDPYHARALVELREPSSGAVHDLDIVIICAAAVFLVDLRSDPGHIEGDDLVWRWNREGRVRHIEHPLRALAVKARVLASRLEAAMRKQGSLRAGERLPRIQPLVLLSADDVDLQVTPAGRACVVTRAELGAALRQHTFPGAAPEDAEARITSIRGQQLRAGLDAIGLRPRRERLQVGAYILGPALAEGRGHQDREAVHRDLPAMRRRARTYLVPDQTDLTARLALRRLADRDASLLFGVREHTGVLTLHDYVAEFPLGPTLLLDAFEGGVPLREFLARRPDLPFTDRLSILEQVALALAHCHRRVVYHGGLGPDAVLVRQPDPASPPEIRVFDFQAGRSPDTVPPTIHHSHHFSEPAAAYRAPELYSSAVVGQESDLFSLGALGFLLFTSRPPASSGVELQRLLAQHGALDPRSASDVIPDAIAEAIVAATRLSSSARGSAKTGADVGAWIEDLRAALHPPTAPGFVPPLQARKGDRLRADLIVESVLGRGASACVLEVKRDDQHYALKVSLGPDQDERLRGEARTLERVRHPHIVQLHETFVLADRQCLLLSLAGESTLQQAIDQQGSLDLDLSLRYGDDLLAALAHLEEVNVGHRDVKPANLGVGSRTRQTKKMLLFDFSLTNIDESQLDAGTESYRDPYLPLRGRWDVAADLYGAAIVLHEMLTGTRPEWRPRGASPLAPDAVLTIARERFDAAARDRLTAFFTTAFARDVAARFPTATAMREAWAAIAESPAPTLTVEASPAVAASPGDVLAALADDAPLDALPLGVRARNALDRAGLTRARDLLALPDNRLSAIRGAGRKVAREIDELRRLWQSMRTAAAPISAVFFPNYRGHDLELDTTEVPPAVTRALVDAGLVRLASVASAPAEQLQTLAHRHGFADESVRAVLQRHHDSADAHAHPTSSQAWLDALLPRHTLVRRWLGLDPAHTTDKPLDAREVAMAAGVPTARVVRELFEARKHGQGHAALPQLHALVIAALDDLGGVAPLPRVAEALRARLGEPGDEPETHTRAAALVRWLAELQPEDLQVVRLHADHPAWVCRNAARGELVRRLGARADELAARDVLPAPAEAETALRALVDGTDLAALPQNRLLELAASASHSAALSSRQELYPRALAADRAIVHTAPALTGDITPDEVITRVRGRYPEAAPVPPRPQLDALLAPLGLHWSGDCYRRRTRDARDTRGSSLNTLGRAASPRRPTAHPNQRTARTPEAEASRNFENRLALALRGREPLLLAVDPPDADRATAELSRVLGRPPALLDRLLIHHLEALARKYAIDPAVLHETDRAGASSPDWGNLLRLAAEAADRIADELLPNKEPLLLARPGLLARFELSAFIARAIHGTRDDSSASLFFLVPCGGRIPRIENALSIPGLPASQRLIIPHSWVANLGRSAASEHPT